MKGKKWIRGLAIALAFLTGVSGVDMTALAGGKDVVVQETQMSEVQLQTSGGDLTEEPEEEPEEVPEETSEEELLQAQKLQLLVSDRESLYWIDENTYGLSSQEGSWVQDVRITDLTSILQGTDVLFGTKDANGYITALNAGDLVCSDPNVLITPSSRKVRLEDGRELPLCVIKTTTGQSDFTVSSAKTSGSIAFRIVYDEIAAYSKPKVEAENLILDGLSFDSTKEFYLLATPEDEWDVVSLKGLEASYYWMGEERQLDLSDVLKYTEILDNGVVKGYKIMLADTWPSEVKSNNLVLACKVEHRNQSGAYNFTWIACFGISKRQSRDDKMVYEAWFINEDDWDQIAIAPNARFDTTEGSTALMNKKDATRKYVFAYVDAQGNRTPLSAENIAWDASKMTVENTGKTLEYEGKQYPLLQVTFLNGFGEYELKEKAHGTVVDFEVRRASLAFYSKNEASYENLLDEHYVVYKKAPVLYVLKDTENEWEKTEINSIRAKYWTNNQQQEIALKDVADVKEIKKGNEKIGYEIRLKAEWPKAYERIDYYDLEVAVKAYNGEESYDWSVSLTVSKRRMSNDALCVTQGFERDMSGNIVGFEQGDPGFSSYVFWTPRADSSQGIDVAFAYRNEDGEYTPLKAAELIYDQNQLELRTTGKMLSYQGQEYELCKLFLKKGVGIYELYAPKYDLSLEYELGYTDVDFFTDKKISEKTYCATPVFRLDGQKTLYALMTQDNLGYECTLKGIRTSVWSDWEETIIPTKDLLTYQELKQNNKVIGYEIRFCDEWPNILKKFEAYALYVDYDVKWQGQAEAFSASANLDINRGNLPLARDSYQIKYQLNGGKNHKSNPATYVPGKAVTLKDPTRTGYQFLGWYNGKTKVTGIAADSKGDITLTAKWKVTGYKITYKLDRGTNAVKNPKNYTVEKAVKLYNPSKKGYKFAGWYTDAKFKKKITSIKKGSTGNVTLYAKWTPIKYKITYRLNGGKNGKKNPTTYTAAQAVKLNSPTKKGYKFAGWYADSKFKKKVTSIKKGSTGNVTLYAKWTAVKKK